MDWHKKIDEGINQSLNVSKKIIKGAGRKAKKIGDQSLLAFEIRELEKEHSRIVAELGESVFSLFMENGRSSVSARTPEIKPLLSRLEKIKELLIEKRSFLDRE